MLGCANSDKHSQFAHRLCQNPVHGFNSITHDGCQLHSGMQGRRQLQRAWEGFSQASGFKAANGAIFASHISATYQVLAKSSLAWLCILSGSSPGVCCTTRHGTAGASCSGSQLRRRTMSSKDSMGPMRGSLLLGSCSSTTLRRSLVSATCLGVRASTRSDGVHAACLGAASAARFSALPAPSLPATINEQHAVTRLPTSNAVHH